MYDTIYQRLYEGSKKRGKWQKLNATDAAKLKKAWDNMMKNIDKPCTLRRVKDYQGSASAR
jgi:hypothetical protein